MNFKPILKIIKLLMCICYYSVCLKIIVRSDYEIEYIIISLLLMLLPFMVFISLKMALIGKNILSIAIIFIYMVIFFIVIFKEDNIWKDKKVYDYYNKIEIEHRLEN